MTIPPIKPVYGVYDFDGQVVLPPGPQPPTPPIEGSMYASGGFVYVWHGSEWVEIGASGGEAGTGVAIVQPTPPDPTDLPEGTWWVDEDSDVTASGGPAIQDEGTALTSRAALNFVGAGVTTTDDAANDRTTVTIPGSTGGLDQTTADARYVNVDGDNMTGSLYLQGGILNLQNTPGLWTIACYGPALIDKNLKVAGNSGSGGIILQHGTLDVYEGDLNVDEGVITRQGIPVPHIIVLGPTDPVPPGTPAGTIIVTKAT